MHANAFARLLSRNQVIYGECNVCLRKQWFRNITPTCNVTKISKAGIKVVQNLISQGWDNETQARGAWKFGLQDSH